MLAKEDPAHQSRFLFQSSAAALWTSIVSLQKSSIDKSQLHNVKGGTDINHLHQRTHQITVQESGLEIRRGSQNSQCKWRWAIHKSKNCLLQCSNQQIRGEWKICEGGSQERSQRNKRSSGKIKISIKARHQEIQQQIWSDGRGRIKITNQSLLLKTREQCLHPRTFSKGTRR